MFFDILVEILIEIYYFLLLHIVRDICVLQYDVHSINAEQRSPNHAYVS